MEKSLLKVESFDQASQKAKRLAREREQETVVRPSDKGWEVLSESTEDEFREEAAEEAIAQQAPNEGYTPDEAISDQDDWARSKEEGWFHGD